MAPQITELSYPPSPERMSPVRNAPAYSHGDIATWLRAKYAGNKPTGGLWTSTYTPDDEYASDWQRGRATNGLIQVAYPKQVRLSVYRLYPDPEARILHIASLDDALEFTRAYHLATIPFPASMRGVAMLTPELTDWQRAARSYDAVHLTDQAADEIAWAIAHDPSSAPTAFHTWNCESSLWMRWKFSTEEHD